MTIIIFLFLLQFFSYENNSPSNASVLEQTSRPINLENDRVFIYFIDSNSRHPTGNLEVIWLVHVLRHFS